MNAAGENIKVFLQVLATGVHITNGSWAFAGDPGHRFIAEGFAAATHDAGGDIVLNAMVKEVMVRDGNVTGVIAEIDGKQTEIQAPIVICTAPPKAMLKLIPENLLPAEFVRLSKRIIHTSMVAPSSGCANRLTNFARSVRILAVFITSH